MHEDEEDGDENGDDGEDGSDPETYAVKGVVVPNRILCNNHVLQGSVAHWPTHFGGRYLYFRSLFKLLKCQGLVRIAFEEGEVQRRQAVCDGRG